MAFRRLKRALSALSEEGDRIRRERFQDQLAVAVKDPQGLIAALQRRVEGVATDEDADVIDRETQLVEVQQLGAPSPGPMKAPVLWPKWFHRGEVKAPNHVVD